jgi:hypothetical protein
MAKLMVSFRDERFGLLALEARDRGITVQELLRAVIVPDWIRFGSVSEPSTESGRQESIRIMRRGGQIVASLNRSRV